MRKTHGQGKLADSTHSVNTILSVRMIGMQDFPVSVPQQAFSLFPDREGIFPHNNQGFYDFNSVSIHRLTAEILLS